MFDFNSMKRFHASGVIASYSARQAALSSLEHLVRDNMDQILEAICKDLGRHPVVSYGAEIFSSLQEIAFARRHLKRWIAPQRTKTSWMLFPGTSFYQARPKGLVAIWGPWNYPFFLLLAPLTGALAAGNCVVLRPSEHAPNCAQLLGNLMEKYFDRDLVRVVNGDAQVAQVLSSYPFDHLFFTGSTQVGKKILAAASENLVPVTLELGGKSPAVVLADACLSTAAKRICWGKFLNCGQTCVAPDYLLVAASILPQFLTTLKDTLQKMYGIDPLVSPDYGKIIHRQHFDRLMQMLSSGNIVYGGTSDVQRLKIAPTLITNPPLDGPLMQEEIFGPLLPIIPFVDPQEVSTFINQRSSPLAAYFFGTNRRQIKQIREQISCGGIAVNDTISHIMGTRLPFGGIGASGMGYYHGKFTFDCFSHQQAVFEQSPRWELAFRYPPYKISLKWLKKW